ncbi:MAG: TPM domain-containing protein [Rhodocyclaceae bacterium]|nr:TPM domain-containing protein [Rhodocyclaceae bacterium]
MPSGLAAVWLTLAVWFSPGAALGANDGFVAIPRLEARVTDLTGTLTRDQQTQLEAALAAVEREKGAQVAVLLLPSTRPETIEQYGIRLAEAWKIGRKGADDGVIVIVAKADRAVRIEVGYGLEGAIPDAVAKRIVEEVVTPRFKAGDFFGGLQAATSALGKIVGGEPLPARAANNVAMGSDLQIFILFALTVVARWARMLLGLLGSLLAAGLAGGLAFMIFGTWLAAAIAALAVFVMSFARAGGGGSGWHTGGGGGFSGGGGGGFSGGGGGFGGGGASGRW